MHQSDASVIFFNQSKLGFDACVWEASKWVARKFVNKLLASVNFFGRKCSQTVIVSLFSGFFRREINLGNGIYPLASTNRRVLNLLNVYLSKLDVQIENYKYYKFVFIIKIYKRIYIYTIWEKTRKIPIFTKAP